MSTGVSDQMKISGNVVKNVERNIPWSQQVDEASYENLSSPTSNDDNSESHQVATQFQYPPFNPKENQTTSNNFKSHKSNSFDTNKKHGKLFYNNLRRDEPHQGPFGARTIISNSSSISLSRSVSSADSNLGNGKRENKSSNKVFSDDKKLNSTSFTPKKTTWASIASQPAKQISRTTLTTSSQKKKGPGMPPPPMIPGKHDLEVNAWDLPNQNVSQFSTSSIDFSPNIKSEFSIGAESVDNQNLRPQKSDKGQSVNDCSVLEEEGRLNLNNTNYGRARNSPNEPTKKNWSNPPLYQNRQPNALKSEFSRRVIGGSSTNSVQNQYDNVQKGINCVLNSRQEVENTLSGDAHSHGDGRAASSDEIHAILDDLRYKNNYNPLEVDLETATSARFFVIKSYSEDDIHRSIKYEIWCSTENGNKRLDAAFKERVKEGGNILLFFSVNGSGHFCGMAQMMTPVDYNSTARVWSEDKWKGKFKVKWIYVKDVPNTNLRHIHLENNDNKSVTKSRDTQEVPNAQGIEMLQIMHSYRHTTSLFDDFSHYEVRQRKETSSKKPNTYDTNSSQSFLNRHYNRQNDETDLRSRNGRTNSAGMHKYFPSNGAGVSFRDRNNRNHYHTNNDHRKFESHRNSDYHHYSKEREANTEKGTAEYSSRHMLKVDNRRDGRALSKLNNEDRSRGLTDECCNKNQSRFHHGPKDPQKDNENTITNRNRRGFDY